MFSPIREKDVNVIGYLSTRNDYVKRTVEMIPFFALISHVIELTYNELGEIWKANSANDDLLRMGITSMLLIG
jgi:uncharacterized membrane protein (GlpM family)